MIDKEIKRALKIIVICLILIMLFGLLSNSEMPFTKSKECKDLMQPIQNVTLGQGERYSYVDGKCVLWYPGTYGYGDWWISLEDLRGGEDE